MFLLRTFVYNLNSMIFGEKKPEAACCSSGARLYFQNVGLTVWVLLNRCVINSFHYPLERDVTLKSYKCP